jgi:hypothetical protein
MAFDSGVKSRANLANWFKEGVKTYGANAAGCHFRFAR